MFCGGDPRNDRRFHLGVSGEAADHRGCRQRLFLHDTEDNDFGIKLSTLVRTLASVNGEDLPEPSDMNQIGNSLGRSFEYCPVEVIREVATAFIESDPLQRRQIATACRGIAAAVDADNADYPAQLLALVRGILDAKAKPTTHDATVEEPR